MQMKAKVQHLQMRALKLKACAAAHWEKKYISLEEKRQKLDEKLKRAEENHQAFLEDKVARARTRPCTQQSTISEEAEKVTV
jgi:G:T/U-mismatch repair DNA glycosylase